MGAVQALSYEAELEEEQRVVRERILMKNTPPRLLRDLFGDFVLQLPIRNNSQNA